MKQMTIQVAPYCDPKCPVNNYPSYWYLKLNLYLIDLFNYNNNNNDNLKLAS